MTIVAAAMIVSLLCIQSGRADGNISDPVVPVNRAESNASGRNVGEVTTTRIPVSETNVTDRPAEHVQDELPTTFQSLRAPEVTRRPEQPTNDSTAELLLVESSRVLDDGVVRGDGLEVALLVHNASAVAAQPLVFASEHSGVNNKNMYPTNHHLSDNNTNIGDDNDENYELAETISTETHPPNNRQVKHYKMVHDDQSKARTKNIAAKKGASTGHLKLYDPQNKMHDYSYTEDDISADEIGENIIGRPEITFPATPWVGDVGVSDQPPRGTKNYGYDYLSPPNAITKDRRRPMQQNENKIDWHTIGTLAFIKLGLLKLQAIGFLNILFLIVFKLKLYMTAVFVKFLLIMKLMKLTKILILPLLILQLLPTLIQLFSMRTSNNMMAMSGANQQGQGLAQGQTGNVLPGTGLTGTAGTAGTAGIAGTAGSGLTGGTTGTTVNGQPSGTTVNGQQSGTTVNGRPSGIPGMGQAGGKKLPSFKLDDLNLISKQHKESRILKNA